ncbi:MAG: adenine phosphoribosyltransferase [bacterium]
MTCPIFPSPVSSSRTSLLFSKPGGFRPGDRTFAERYRHKDIDHVVGIESRGFIFGAALAHVLKKGFVLVRKTGKLPWRKVSETYDLEYGTDTIQMHEDSVKKDDRVLVVDDLLATGGTAKAACQLIRKMGGQIVECAFVVELDFLKGREKLKGTEVFSLVQY